MKLSQYNAELIVSEINEIINEKMNIMDSNGIIIASTDESRGEKTLALAKIIKRMTEILVLEIILKEEKEREK